MLQAGSQKVENVATEFATIDDAPIFGQISVEEAVSALYAGVPDRDQISDALDTPYWVWHGPIPSGVKDKTLGPVGRYIVANPYLTQRVLDLAQTPKKGQTLARGIKSVTFARHGLRKEDVGMQCVLYVERDEGTVQEQLEALRWLEEAAGFRFTVLTLSGDTRPASAAAAGVELERVVKGKSIHAFVAIEPTDIETFTAILRLFICLLRSDPAIVDPVRLMRLPGAVGGRQSDYANKGPQRIQTCIRADASACYKADELLERLTALAVEEGITNPHGAYCAMQYAGEIRKRARNIKGLSEAQKAECMEVFYGLAHEVEQARCINPDLLARLQSAGAPITASGLLALTPDAHVEQPAAAQKAQSEGKKAQSEGKLTVKKVKQSLKKGLGTNVVYLDDQTPIYCADGSVLWLGSTDVPERGIRCYDPVLEDPTHSSSPSARLYSGRVFSEAAGSRTLYKAKAASGTLAPSVPSAPAACSDEPWVLPPLPTAQENPCVLVATPMCSRKTTQLAQRVAALRGEGRRSSLIITPTVALSSEAAVKFNARLYSDVDGDIHISEPYVICGPSIRRIGMGDILDEVAVGIPKLDLIVIEEIEQTMGILHNRAIMRRDGNDIRGTSYSMLQALCMACVAGGGQVIALDAHASERAKSDLRRLTGLDPYVVTAPEGARTVWTGLPEFQYPDMEGLLTALLDCADDKDQRGIVYANSQHDVLAIARLLGQRGRSVVAIHANATPADRATLVDVNTEWDKADFVVYNDAAGSGVSFDGTGRHAFALVRHWPGYTWANPMQGVGRCRKPLTLSSWVSDRVQSGSTDRKHIRTQLFKTISSSLDLAYGVNAAGAPVAAPRNNEYFESMVDHEWTLRVRGAHLAQDYYAIREGLYGVVLTQMPPMDETSKKAVARVFSAARDEVKGEIVEEAQSAPTITEIEAADLSGKTALTAQERARLNLFNTRDRWGVVTEDLLRDTCVGRGKMYGAAREFSMMALAAKGKVERLAELERRCVEVRPEKQYGVSAPVIFSGQSSNNSLRATLLNTLINCAGIDTGLLTGSLVCEGSGQEVLDTQVEVLDKVEGQEAGGSCGLEVVEDVLFDSDQDEICLSKTYAVSLYKDEVGVGQQAPHWSNDSLVAMGWVTAVRKHTRKLDLALLGLPSIPRDFDKAPAAYLGKLLASIGVKTTSERLPVGSRGMDGKLTADHSALTMLQTTQESSWRAERRAAKKEGRPVNHDLAPPARVAWYTLDAEALGSWSTLCARAFTRVSGGNVKTVSALLLPAQESVEEVNFILMALSMDAAVIQNHSAGFDEEDEHPTPASGETVDMGTAVQLDLGSLYH